MTNTGDDKPGTADYFWAGIAILIVAPLVLSVVAVIVFPLAEQALSWLRFGTIPHRDLFWAVSDTACAATDWQDKGWAGKDICRVAHIDFTEWVGMNKILNYFFDVHIAAVAVFSFIIAVWLISSVIEAVFYTQEVTSSPD